MLITKRKNISQNNKIISFYLGSGIIKRYEIQINKKSKILQYIVPDLTIDLNQNKNKFKMQRASSISNLKIEFNPRQIKVGHSSIDKLPLRKCNSSKSISQVSQISQNQERMMLQSQQYNIQMLKRINQSLQRQNAYLKKQLDFFTQACSSRRASINNIGGLTNKKKQDSGFKDKILSRLDSKNDTESTGLFNSKMSSGRKQDQIEDSISEVYSKYNVKKLLPKAQTVKNLASNFLQSIKQNYLKLRIIVDQINLKSKQGEKIGKQTLDIMGFLEMTVIYCKNPKAGKSILIQKQKQVKNKKQISKQQRVEQILNQFSTISQLICLFESIMREGAKNTKFIAHLKTSISFTRLIKKITQK